MKTLLLTLLLAGTTILVAWLTYVDNFDGVYPYPVGSISGYYNIDLNNDQQNDINVLNTMSQLGSLSVMECNPICWFSEFMVNSFCYEGFSCE